MTLPYTRTRSWASPAQDQLLIVAGTSNQQLGPYLIGQTTKGMTDVVTPGYSRLVQDGVVINNPCKYDEVEVRSTGSGHGSYKSGSYDYTISGPLTWFRAGQVYPAGPNVNIGASAATAKFHALAAIDPTPYAFGEDALEIRETLRFLKDPLHSLRELSRVIKKQRSKTFQDARKRAKRSGAVFEDRVEFHKALADVWLQYRFAAMPLVRSIHDGYEALQLPHKAKVASVRKSARGFSEDGGAASNSYDTVDSGTTYTWSTTRVRNVRYHASILYEITNPIYDWRYTLGLRNKDLPETLWQVLPLSFLVDRVVNVSSAIRGLTNLADPRISILAASVTRKDLDELSFTLINETRPSWTISAYGETRTRKQFTYEREPYSPSMSDAIPPVNIGGLAKDATELLDVTNIILQNIRL